MSLKHNSSPSNSKGKYIVSILEIEELKNKILHVREVLCLEEKKIRIGDLGKQMEEPDVWSDQNRARMLSQELASLVRQCEVWDVLLYDTEALAELAVHEDVSLEGEIEKYYADVFKRYEALELTIFFSGPYDKNNAIFSLHAGTGGVDAMDWTEMLMRMYLRFCEQMGWSARVIDEQRGGEAGMKSVAFEVSGEYVYGHLKAEQGVHRLVRISPFDAEGLRQTSFALVEVLPDVGEDAAVEINQDDIKIDVYRAGGHGGQSVNTTDSAVRITHVPTGIVVTCQNERSQLQNKETAFKMLRGKLQRLADAEREEERKQLKGVQSPAAWGNQIRSYVLNPYRMVKDHRTEYETSDVQGVLDGDLLPFVEAYVKRAKK